MKCNPRVPNGIPFVNCTLCEGPRQSQGPKSLKKVVQWPKNCSKVGFGGSLEISQKEVLEVGSSRVEAKRKTYFRTYFLTCFQTSPKSYLWATFGLLYYFLRDFGPCGWWGPSQCTLSLRADPLREAHFTVLVFLPTVGSLPLTVELLCLQSCLGAFFWQ